MMATTSSRLLVRRLLSSSNTRSSQAKRVAQSLTDFGKCVDKVDKWGRRSSLVEILRCLDTDASCGDGSANAVVTQLNKIPRGIFIGMDLKQAVAEELAATKKNSKSATPPPAADAPNNISMEQLKLLDSALKLWISTVFHYDSISLKTITFDTASGQLLEKVARAEAVHSVRSLSELKRRLHNGRQCFALFHFNIPNDPIAFLHVAFTPALAPSLRYLNSVQELAAPTHAMFYSVNSPIPALSKFLLFSLCFCGSC
jgi:hypothetical protein